MCVFKDHIKTLRKILIICLLALPLATYSQLIIGSTKVVAGSEYEYKSVPFPADSWSCTGCTFTTDANVRTVKLIWNDAGTTQTLTANSAGESYSRTITIVDNNNIFAGSGSTSEIYAADYNVPRSESGCSGTGVYAVLKHDSDYPDFASKGYPFNKSASSDNTGISVTKIGTSDGDRANMTLHWVPNWTGTIRVTIYYSWRGRDDAWDHVGDCDAKDFPLVSYTVTRCTNPLGSLAGSSLMVSKTIDNTIQLEYQTNFTDIPEIKFFVDAQLVQQGESKVLSYNTSEFKAYTITTSILDKCGTWWPGPSKTVSVQPTCYVNNPSSVRLGLLGFGYDANGYEIRKDIQYTITNHAVTDFSDHYNLDVRDGANDLTFNINSFILSKGLGSYRIIAVRKEGRELCPAIPELKIFAGGRDEKIENDCPIFLPEDLTKFNFNNPLDPSILEHFAATVISKKAIIIKPGVTLALGAEMILINSEPVPDPLDTDKTINFVQSKSYDEYGALLNESRSYFDTDGKPLQSQSKNFDADVVLASQSVYDAYQRSVLNTLPAPIYVGTKGEATDECNGKEVIGHDMNFKYKPDFIKASNGDIYSYRHFDLEKQESPEPVLSSEPGTLGWYYSLNNGTATGDNTKMNEPLVAVTQYPFSRAIYQPDGSGLVKGVTKPGDAFKPGSGRLAVSSIEKVENEDPYLSHYFNIRANELGFQRPPLFEGNFLRGQTTDENGQNSITYSDIEGHSLIHLYFSKNDISYVAPLSRSYQFYNDLGQVVLTLSPNALQQYDGSNFSAIDKTEYQYNNKELLVKLIESDGGATEYVYAKDGRLRFSRNAEQEKSGRYSYTHYDRLGRPVESGEVSAGVIGFKSIEMMSIVDHIGDDGFTKPGNEFSTRIQIYYDQPAGINLGERQQEFVMGAVSYSKKDDKVISYYSYDELGRVKWMVQDIKDLGVKTIDYVYGPTGNVQQITYEKDNPGERFTHFYEHNRNGGLHKLFTTTELLSYNKNGKLTNAGITYNAQGKIENQGVLELQATYFYYLHGSIKRIEYANKLQGIDYVYTVDGALKSINDAVKANDPGGDDDDVFGMTLDYYNGDYLSSDYTPEPITYPSTTVDSYNNIIKGARWHGPSEANNTFAYAYEYDDHYQFKKATWGSAKTGNLLFLPDIYEESIGELNTNGYDGNGNIQRLKRKNSLGKSIADFKYNYIPYTNKLETITKAGNPTDYVMKYNYNLLGQMTMQETTDEDTQHKMEYDATGKVIAVRSNDNKFVTSFSYDDRGFRLNKTSYDENGVEKTTTWYVRDASGTLISTYEDDLVDSEPSQQTELPIYATSRIGLFKPQYGLTFYEVNDHLGNVRAVIGEKLTAEYLATMETERVERETEDFVILKRSISSSSINHTPETGVINVGEPDEETFQIDNPNEVIRINNKPMNESHPDPIGGGKELWVHPKDKIKAQVFVKYADFDKTQNNPLTGIGSYLVNVFDAAHLTVDGVSIFNGLNQLPSGVFAGAGDIKEEFPRAFLTYIVYDKNHTPIAFDQVQVSEKANITGQSDHELLEFEITVESEGFVYVYVSNQTDQNLDVYFDDLLITHEYSEIVAGSDFYPFGLPISERQITREDYRFGYQGQYSEKDEETGWNHFDLREYDPVVGRWTTKDPYGQYYSPYMGMGNNPISGVDPDGGWDDVYYDSKTDQTTIVKTDDNFDRFYYDGKFQSIQNRGWGLSVFGLELDPSTLYKNTNGLSYPGGNNPRSHNGDYNFSYVPYSKAEYPAIGHDRRYGNLGAAGATGLLFDTRAIGADWKFVAEEYRIAFNPSNRNEHEKLDAFLLGTGLGAAASFKTIYTVVTKGPVGAAVYIGKWYGISSVGVTNKPSK